MSAKPIAAKRLADWLKENEPPVLLHVLPEESYSREHLPGAHRATVYEVDFLDQARQAAPDANRPVVVYGAGAESKEASVAGDKLQKNGYTNVWEFAGGLKEWRKQAFPVEGQPSADEHEPQPLSGSFRLDLEKSVIRWTGANLASSHAGTLHFNDGTFDLHNGRLIDARFEINMQSLACDDLKDPQLNQMLIAHLSSDDFFDIAKYPTARFVLSTADPLAAVTPGSPNYRMTGELTVKGVTDQITFPAIIGQTDSSTLAAQAHLEFDRTRWDVQYGSGKFFASLGKHLVNDLVHLHLVIAAMPG
jgi:polyisoprenoid-binding protein YceI/rhodanese-related sulfurtransferase